MSETGQLGKDEPHPVALFPAPAQFGEDTRIYRGLRIDKSLKIKRIGHGELPWVLETGAEAFVGSGLARALLLTMRGESGRPYDVTADDAAYAVLEFASGVIASVNSSWAVRVNRRELVELHVDGTNGSAVAGLRRCAVQHRVSTPLAVWNPDLPDPVDYLAQWTEVPDNAVFDNAFKVQWEHFLRAAAEGTPLRWDLAEGAKGVQLAGLALRSSAEGRRVDVPALVV